MVGKLGNLTFVHLFIILSILGLTRKWLWRSQEIAGQVSQLFLFYTNDHDAHKLKETVGSADASGLGIKELASGISPMVE
jgi:hypothetical protein